MNGIDDSSDESDVNARMDTPFGGSPWYCTVSQKNQELLRRQIWKARRKRKHESGQPEHVILSPAGFILRYEGDQKELEARCLEEMMISL